MKLEHLFQDATFLAPKVYGGKNPYILEITKVKGYKNPLAYSELKSLLIKDSYLKLNHEK
jgi:hypothetical protein